MVQTPVGARCPTCARVSGLPTYRISRMYYIRAVGEGIGMAVVCGLVWGFIQSFFSFFYLSLLIAGGVGYAIAEVIGLSVNKKRGTGLAVAGGLAVLLSYIVASSVFGFWHFNLLDLLAIAIGVFVAAANLR